MPSDLAGWLTIIGGLCFGIVVGWVTYRTLRYAPHGGLSDLSTVIGAVGGAAITALFPKDSGAFGAYCIGLAIGFFATPNRLVYCRLLGTALKSAMQFRV